MIHITGSDLKGMVPMADAVSAVRRAFIELAGGHVEQPPRLALSDGTFLAMAASVQGSGTSAKLVTVHPSNRKLGLPTVQAMVVWFEPVTGVPGALIDGDALTTIRTGAVVGVATDLLASPAAKSLAMIGAGGLAADQVRAVACVRKLSAVRVYSLHTESSQRLVDLLQPELADVSFAVCASAMDATVGADIVCTATPSLRAVLDDEGVRPDCHINAVGAYRPDMCELPGSLLARAAIIVVDQLTGALAEAGDLIQAIRGGWIREQDFVELGTLLTSTGPNNNRGGISVFKSVGLAVQDWALASLAVERAKQTAI